MAQQADSLSVQTPSEALASGSDPVSEAQKKLDTEGKKEQATFTKEDVAAIVKEAVSPLQAEVRGLQGVADRTAKTVQDMTQGARKQQVEAHIASLPEDQQAFARFQQNQIEELSAQATQPAPAVMAGLDAEGVVMVQEYGISPTDPRLDLTGYARGGSGGVKALMDSIYKIQAPAPAPVPTVSQDNLAPPALNAAPPTDGAGLNSLDDWNDALITGRVSNKDYIEGTSRLRPT